jgi:hypothetical protein
MLDNFAWRRVIRMLMERHRWRWKDVRRWLVGPTGSWRPIAAGGTALRPIAAIPVNRYRYRGSQIPSPHGGFGERSGETGREQSRNRAPGLLCDGSIGDQDANGAAADGMKPSSTPPGHLATDQAG